MKQDIDITPLWNECERLRAINAELLAALECLVTAQNEGPEDRVEREMANARAAISKAKETRL